jgi:hypothetical protein
LPGAFILGFPPIAEKVLGAFLMNNVVERATRNKDYHDDNVCLHDSGRNGRRKRSKGIDAKH